MPNSNLTIGSLPGGRSLEALGRADGHLVEGYLRSKQAGGPAFAVYRRMVLEREAKRLLAAKSEPTKDAA